MTYIFIEPIVSVVFVALLATISLILYLEHNINAYERILMAGTT